MKCTCITSRQKTILTQSFLTEMVTFLGHLRADVPESCPSSPLFVPMGTERSSRGLRAPSKDGNYTSTDSEELEVARRGRAKAKRRKEQPRCRRRNSRGSEASLVHQEENLSDSIQRGQSSGVKVPENRSHGSKRRENVNKNTGDTRPNVLMNTTDKTDQKQYVPENTSVLENRSEVPNDRSNMPENKQSFPSNKPNSPEDQPNITESKQNIPENRKAVLESKPDLIKNKPHAPNPQPPSQWNPQNVSPEGKSNPLPAHQTQAQGEFNIL